MDKEKILEAMKLKSADNIEIKSCLLLSREVSSKELRDLDCGGTVELNRENLISIMKTIQNRTKEQAKIEELSSN